MTENSDVRLTVQQAKLGGLVREIHHLSGLYMGNRYSDPEGITLNMGRIIALATSASKLSRVMEPEQAMDTASW